jgi:predicted nucleic acid-binding protein
MIAVLDSNVLVRVFNTDDDLHSTVRHTLRLLHYEGYSFVILPQIAGEYWSVCTRPPTSRRGLGLSIEQADDRLTRLTKRWMILEDAPGWYGEWRKQIVSARCSGRQVHDARIASVMKVHNIQTLITFNDGDFERYPHIVAINPNGLMPEQEE